MAWTGAGNGGRLFLVFLVVFLVAFFDDEVVGDSEDAGDAVGLDAGDLFVHGAGDDAFEGDVAVFHDDVNGRHGAHLVLAEDVVTENLAVDGAADAVIVDRGRKDFDVVDDLGDALIFLTTFSESDLSVGRETWPRRVTVPSLSTL